MGFTERQVQTDLTNTLPEFSYVVNNQTLFIVSEHHSKCPCYGQDKDFQKVLNLKDTGLVIYCYNDRKKNLDQTAHTDNNTTGSAIILQNTKSMKLLSVELLPELDKNKITCPRCRQILKHTQELLNKIPGVDSGFLGICDHCRLKAETQKQCNRCGKIIQKFLSTHHKQKEDLKKYIKLWLTTIGNVLDRPHKITTRTYSEKDLNLSVLEIGIPVDKLGTQPMFHSETNLLKTRMSQKLPPLDLEKGVHFRESYKPAETISMTRSDSKRIVSRVDSIQEKEDHTSELDTNKAIKHSHLTEDEINIQRRMAKYRHDQAADKELRKTISKEFKEKKIKREHVDKGEIKDKYKDAKGEKLIATQGKAQTTKKDAIQTTPKKEDALLKSKRREKDTETTKFKKIKKSLENLRKLAKAPKLLSDQADKQLTVKVDKKRQLEEKEIQSKLKDIKTKEKPMLPSEMQTDKITRQRTDKIDASKIEPREKVKDKSKKQKDSEENLTKSINWKKNLADLQKQHQAEKQIIEKEDKKRQHEQAAIRAKVKDNLTKEKKDDPLNKPLRKAVAVKLEPKRSEPTTPKNTVSEQQLAVSMTAIKLQKPSIDILKLITIKKNVPKFRSIHEMPPLDLLLKKRHVSDKQSKRISISSIISKDSTQILNLAEIEGIIIGEDLYKQPPLFFPVHLKQQQVVPLLFKSEYFEKPPSEPREQIKEVSEEENNNKVDPESRKGIVRYALSDRSFIDKGWTLLPTEKVVRKMNVYRMRPAHPEFDWFEHNKHKRCIQYDTSEKFAEFDDNGRGRWYYKNGRLALDYYNAEETNAQQRFVVYSSGEPDERGRSRPITVLATFDYLGNGIVLDHAGKIRLSTEILFE